MPRYNPLVERLAPPPIPSVHAWARAYDGSRGALIDLSQAVPGYPPHADMLKWLGEASASTASTGYGPIEGETALRAAYATHVAGLYGAGFATENIQITSGCNQAFIVAALAVAGAGESVLVTNPFYFNHETTLSMMGVKVELTPCDPENGFLPDVAALKVALHSGIRALALITPNNPTGAVYPPELVAEIFALCREKGVWLLLDETYRDFLPGDGAPHGLFSLPGWEENLIGLYSFSKSFCIPGHRLGAITAGAETIRQIAKIMDNVQICAPRAAQMALTKALPALDDWRMENRAEIARRTEALKTVLGNVEGWEIGAIGAYFAYIRHPFQGVSSEKVAEHLARQAGIVSIPGTYFGEGQDDYLRFAFANADVATIERLEERLKVFAGP
ncbi:MAG: aminotransferase [Proteobacteria bacterium]|nr:aminotransferase [Pseudomonadota bacterium]